VDIERTIRELKTRTQEEAIVSLIKHGLTERVFQLEYMCPHTVDCTICLTGYPHSTCNLDLDAHEQLILKKYGLGGYV